MPNRILKDSINESRALTSCSFFSQELYKRLITYADDYGRFNADPEIVLARLYPRELAVVRLEDLMEGLIELAGVGKIAFYTAKPRHEVYGAFPNWGSHQRLRDSKAKCPDPEDTEINDWYLRRYIPQDMKVRVIERDGFKCCSCGKHIVEGVDARRLVKMGDGLYHIDHIVPVNQGGRATMENLRLLCPKCNLSRQKHFSFEEILQFANGGGNSLDSAAESGEQQQPAETRRNSPQLAAVCESLRPESESESESNPKREIRTRAREHDAELSDRFSRFWAAYPRKEAKKNAEAAFRKIDPDEDLLARMLASIEKWAKSEQWTKDGQAFIPHPATWLNGRRWEDEPPRPASGAGGRNVSPINQFQQRDYSGAEKSLSELLDEIETCTKEMASGGQT